MSRIRRKHRRKDVAAARKERWASRSKYAAKKWTQEHGSPPDPRAVSEATKKGDA